MLTKLLAFLNPQTVPPKHYALVAIVVALVVLVSLFVKPSEGKLDFELKLRYSQSKPDPVASGSKVNDEAALRELRGLIAELGAKQ